MRNLYRLRVYKYKLIESTGFEYFIGNKVLFILKFFSVMIEPEADK